MKNGVLCSTHHSIVGTACHRLQVQVQFWEGIDRFSHQKFKAKIDQSTRGDLARSRNCSVDIGSFFFSIAFDSSISKFCWARSSSNKLSVLVRQLQVLLGRLGIIQLELMFTFTINKFLCTVPSKYFRTLLHGKLLSALQIRYYDS